MLVTTISRIRSATLWSAVLAALIASTQALAAPYFTRIVDASNPVVNDGLETGGGAWADLDGDGLLELFAAHGNLSNQNDALYHNQGAFTFIRVVTVPMASDGGSSIGGTWGDYDNDGRLDLFVANRNSFGNFLYHAIGDTAFERVLTGPVATDLHNSNSGSWVDIDGDDDLDLFVVNFQGVDDLYLNDGPPSYTFTAVDTGLVLGGAEFSIPGAWCDYDDDGDPDLFVGHAGSQNDYLYAHGPGLSFTRTTFTDGRATLGASWGDYDNDDDLDLFTASFLNQVSLLYANSGEPDWTLTPVASPALASSPGNAVGSAWGDFDNDADLDLLVARDGQDNYLFRNTGPPDYTLERVDTLGVSTDGGASFGCSWVDVDGDGDLDVFVANRSNQSDFLYRNDGAAGSWLKVRLVGTASNRAGIGARVRVRALVGGIPRWQVRDVEAQSGYNSQTLELHFGLADAAAVDSMVVRWPSGHTDVVVNLPANRAYRVLEGVGPLAVDPGHSPIAAPRWTIAPNPVRHGLAIDFELPAPTRIELSILDVTGRRVAPPSVVSLPAGRHRLERPSFKGAADVYFARLAFEDRVECRAFVRLP